MSRKESDESDHWLRSLARELTESAEILPPKNEGWETIREMVERLNLGNSRVTQIVRAAMRAGSVERFAGKQRLNGLLHVQYWYRERPCKRGK